MKITLQYLFLSLFLCIGLLSLGQSQFNLSKSKSSKIKFQLINNIIVMPVELNGVQLSFVLDTGVRNPILFNLANLDSLQIRNTERSYLRGLGSNGSIQAIKSKGNIIKIGEAIAVNAEVSLVFDPSINFTPRLGVAVHGIIGFDIFKDFVVELNYSGRYIRLHNRSFFKPKESSRWKKLPIEIIDKKPYLNAEINYGLEKTPVKLLMDTGSSDALWLFEGSHQNIKSYQNMFFDDFLGKGLSGAVYGKRSKVKLFNLDNFELRDVNVAYPDSIYLTIARNNKSRNGSISGNILKRFNFFFDYKGKQIWLRKNNAFKDPFYYNNSGIVLEQRGYRVVKEKEKRNQLGNYGRKVDGGNISINLDERYKFVLKPSFQVVELRENSNANAAGVKLGDIILSINGKQTSELSLQQVNAFFYNKKGTVLRVRVDRAGTPLFFKFALDDVFKKKSPQIEGSN